MRVVFMGTPAFAATILKKLNDACDVVGVFTRPDAVRGRGGKLVASPVKQVALEAGIPVVEAQSFRDDEAFEALVDMAPDVVCVAAYGALLPKKVLDLPCFGCVNVHASLLPRWRGAAPIERAILAHDEFAGVSIMKMAEKLDAGDYCMQEQVPVDAKKKDELESELAVIGADLLIHALEAMQAGGLDWVVQDESGVTYASKVEKAELDICSQECVEDILAKVQASSDAHPSHTVVAGKQVTMERASAVDAELAAQFDDLKCGEVAFRTKRLVARCSDGFMEINQLKPQGKKSMDAKAFCAGLQNAKNAIFEWGIA